MQKPCPYFYGCLHQCFHRTSPSDFYKSFNWRSTCHPWQTMPELTSDCKFQPDEQLHMRNGEILAQASSQAEVLACKVVGLPYKKYVGRAQYPQFKTKPTNLVCMTALRLQQPTSGVCCSIWCGSTWMNVASLCKLVGIRLLHHRYKKPGSSLSGSTA